MGFITEVMFKTNKGMTVVTAQCSRTGQCLLPLIIPCQGLIVLASRKIVLNLLQGFIVLASRKIVLILLQGFIVLASNHDNSREHRNAHGRFLQPVQTLKKINFDEIYINTV